MFLHRNCLFSILCLIGGLLIVLPSRAHADCSNPLGVAGTIEYFSAGEQIFKYCNGSNWISWGVWTENSGDIYYNIGDVGIGTNSPASALDINGGVRIGYDGGSCTGTNKGTLRYTSASDAWEYCNGSAWSPFKEPCTAPTLCQNIGDVCDDSNGTNDPDPIFAGFMVYNDTNSADAGTCKPLYVTNANQSTSSQWKTSTGADDIATDSTEDGKINDGQVPNSSTFPAFKLCKDLTDGGFSDWYLPARDELNLLWKNASAIDANAAGNFTTSYYLSSTENPSNNMWHQLFSYGMQDTTNKTDNNDVRCVRRD